MKIKQQAMFYTPKSMEELENIAERYTDGERIAFVMGMMQTWNFLAYMMEQEDNDDSLQDS